MVDDFRYVRPSALGECQQVQCLQDAIRFNFTHLNSPDTFTATAIATAVEVCIVGIYCLKVIISIGLEVFFN